MKMKKGIIIAVVAVLACGGGTYTYFYKYANTTKKQTAVQETVYTVKKGNIRSVISGTAQLEPQQQQTIVPPKEGMIKTINLQRNMNVKKGDLLLELSDSSLDEKLDSARLTLSQQQSDLADLQKQYDAQTIVAPAGGKFILATNVSEGAGVSKTTKIGTIANSSLLTVTLPFLQDEAAQIHKGDTVQLTIDGYMLTKTGTVDSVSSSVKSDSKGNRLLDVKINIDNDGTMDEGQIVKGTVPNGGINIESKATAALQYRTSQIVMAGVSGTIDSLDIKENRQVNKGERIGTIVNDTLKNDITNKQNQINQSNKSIADLEDQLEKLKVYAPFDGVFSTDFADQKKNVLTSYPVGTTISQGVSLGAVANMDVLQLPVKVDELDLLKVKVGQKAEVKVDAITGKTFTGEVTQLSTVGTTTNGVTTYTAVVSIKNEGDLKNAMTATADILVEDKKNVLVAPVEAVKQKAGKRIVTLKKADGTVEQDHEVQVGANTSTLVEITSGLSEGDTIVMQAARTQTKMNQQQIDQMRQQFQQGARGGNSGGGGGGGGMGGPPPGF
ncbi:HlyD family efflux transporter periplasmic adaptor subunit [Paenibacillus thalictri]|uniref:HlyD family efflux transporter periplasmic adaptor subunit n=1 Tax=Paenibacillus thalictri TaxID=2527873 RepID=A0A4Q9DWF6_9BACL|nr:HlyD family efflux transporter periplasmic adaptor subunit [Paenibacillus thalictri]TBL81369.1 HlyD family efflux transporter periplasmic adaptor subunit [Paenibacillus thalictri]